MDEESACVSHAQQGSSEAFTRLVEAYQTPVYNLCYRMLGQHEAAEDAAQETFLRAYQYLDRYDCRRPFATWLLSIAAHYCIDGLRRRRYSTTAVDHGQETNHLQLADAHAPNPESEVARREQRGQIQALLKSLNAVDRAVIVMRYWHECSEAEIADSLGLTVSSVKSRLFRARRELAGLWHAASTTGPGVFGPAASLQQAAASASGAG
jgi:RNA polymerase sigma-70 factor (ECF subfamily)